MNINSFKLDGKRAIITGGAQGLGAEISKALSNAGASISIFDLNGTGAEKVAKSIKEKGNKAIAIQMDVREPDQVEDAIKETVSSLGGIDILINDAGVTGHEPLEEMSLKEWNRVVDTNLTGTFLCSQAAARQMIKQGTGGSIVNISSMSAFIVNKGSNNTHYCSSKAGVSHFTKSAACDWAKYGIRMNAIAPSYFATEMAMDAALKYPEIRERIEKSVPLGRVAQPDEIGGLAIFLCSEASGYMTGTTVLIDGGYTCW